MSESPRVLLGGLLVTWLGAGMFCGIAVLAWFGYRATSEWQRSSALLVERRSQQAADLLTLALTRDMRGMQTSVLLSEVESRRVVDPSFDLTDIVTVAFARYPYPESFFEWRAGADEATVLFTRGDRQPGWLPAVTRTDTYPIEIALDARSAALLRNRIATDVDARRRYSLFELTLAGTTYQVVALICYRDSSRERLESVFGFMVNLTWARNEYFGGITEQVSALEGTSGAIQYAILDERNQVVVGAEQQISNLAAVREFPLYFFDPMLTAVERPSDLTQRIWKITANAGSDPALAAAARGSRRTLLVVSAAVIALALSLLVALRSARAGAALAAVRADFVSTITHDLKTPLATIRSVGEMLLRDRIKSAEDLKKYAHILVQEEKRLSRRVTNLLAYARVTDVADVYSFQPQDPAELVAEAILGFRRQLTGTVSELEVDSNFDVPQIRADRTAVVLALDNLIDNAIRYSKAPVRVSVSVRATGPEVHFNVVDAGVGISPEELLQVRRRFRRGRDAKGSGSGLGLAIVSRIAEDHGGRLEIVSEFGTGTKATLTIPTVLS